MLKKTDPRISRTKEMLKDSLVVLMKKKSINEITVQDLTDTAGLSRSTFYRNYNDINDFLIKITDEVVDGINERCMANRYAPCIAYHYRTWSGLC